MEIIMGISLQIILNIIIINSSRNVYLELDKVVLQMYSELELEFASNPHAQLVRMGNGM